MTRLGDFYRSQNIFRIPKPTIRTRTMASNRTKCDVCYADCSSLLTKRVVKFPFSGFDLLAEFIFDCNNDCRCRTSVAKVHFLPINSRIVTMLVRDLSRFTDMLFEILSKNEPRGPHWKWKLRGWSHPQNVLEVYHSDVRNLFNLLTVLMSMYLI